MEAVHSKVYSNLITTFIDSQVERDELFDSINTNPIIKKKADWCLKWMGDLDSTSPKDFFKHLVAFLAVEGIFFSGSFASIFWLRDRGILANSLGVANELISRDECTPEGTEVLTADGFLDFREVTPETLIAQYHKGGKIDFVKPLRIINRDYEGDMVHIQHNTYHVAVTPNHDMLGYNHKTDELKKIKAKDIKFNNCSKIPVAGKIEDQTDRLTNLERLYIAIQADGSKTFWQNLDGEKLERGDKDGYNYNIQISRLRKIERLDMILTDINIKYKKIPSRNGFKYSIHLDNDFDYKTFDWVEFKGQTWCKEFVEETIHWDGHLRSENISIYCSTNKKCIDIVQTASIFAGFETYICHNEDNRKETYKDYYRLSIKANQSLYRHANSLKKTLVPYKGKVYCVEVPTGMIITRFEDKVAIIGNCTHADFAALLVNEYGGDDKPTDAEITEILVSALDLEKEFIKEALPDKLFGMNQDLMSQYLEFITDVWLNALGVPTKFGTANPFPFMASIGQRRKDLFFEKTKTNYARAVVSQEMDWAMI